MADITLEVCTVKLYCFVCVDLDGTECLKNLFLMHYMCCILDIKNIKWTIVNNLVENKIVCLVALYAFQGKSLHSEYKLNKIDFIKMLEMFSGYEKITLICACCQIISLHIYYKLY